MHEQILCEKLWTDISSKRLELLTYLQNWELGHCKSYHLNLLRYQCLYSFCFLLPDCAASCTIMDRSVLAFLKYMDSSVLAFLKCMNGSIWTHQNGMYCSVFPKKANWVYHNYYARKSIKIPIWNRYSSTMHSSHHLALMRELLVATSTLHGLPQAIGARVHANFLTKKVTSLSRLVRRSTFLNVHGSFCFGGRYLPISI